MRTYLGIDVGSISTKFVLIDEENRILFSSYFRTAGNPIEAVKKGLRELKKFIPTPNPGIEIFGVGTTGSARYLTGVITGADLIKNEITAHARGTSYFIPDVKTVIEIGGQDSKVIILENGVVVDFAMNLICLKGNTKITTNPSYASTLIKEIKIGQKVLTHSGKFKPVEQVFERKYQGEMIHIEVSNLKKLDITPNHSILGLKREDIKCYRSYSRNNIAICKPSEERICNKTCTRYKKFSWEPKFIPAKELRPGDFIATPLPLTNQRNPYKSFIHSKWIFEPIRKIRKYNFNGMVYNLNVKDDHSYVANFINSKNCSAGTGAFLDAQAFRMGVPIEKFGEIALKSKSPTAVGSRCTVFCESDMIHKQQIGHSQEDIIAGLCQGLARNFLANVAKGKKIKPPIVFLGGVSENLGMRKAFEDILNEKIIVPSYNTVMGAFGVALLIKENPPQRTKFFGFEISDKDIKCTSFQCQGCPNRCEVIEARIEGKVISRWGDRCGKWSNLNYE